MCPVLGQPDVRFSLQIILKLLQIVRLSALRNPAGDGIYTAPSDTPRCRAQPLLPQRVSYRAGSVTECPTGLCHLEGGRLLA